MIFDNVKSIVIPEGSVKEITCNNVTLWQKIRTIIETVSGVGTIVLQKVIRLVGITQYGKCEQASTPTPSAPVDIMCNNGALRMVHRSGLPNGYRLLEYVGGSGSQYVITDLYLASTDVVECEYRISSTTGYGAVYGIFKTGESSALYGNQTYYGYDSANNKVDTDIRVDTEWHTSRHDFVNGTLTIDDTTVTFTPFEFVNSTKNAVLSRYYNDSYGYNWKGYVRKFKVTRGNEVICDLLPAKNSSNVTGLYDLISGNFYTATGGTLLEGNEVDDYELSVVGTPEVLTISGANLLDPTTVSDENKFISRTNGTEVTPSPTGGTFRHSDYIPIISGETYYFGVTPFQASTAGLAWYSEESTSGYISGLSGTQLNNAGMKATAPNDATHIRFSWRIDEGYDTDWGHSIYLCKVVDDTPILSKWEAYTEPQTASVENLLGVGDYKDEQEIISGAVTHRLGIKVFDGTENWELHSATSGTYRLDGVFTDLAQNVPILSSLLCTNLFATNTLATATFTTGMARWAATSDGSVAVSTQGTRLYACFGVSTVEEVKAFLASQYASGTPVIILYPLAEATTESVTPQSFTVNETAIISAESDYIDNIALSGAYETPEA